MSKYIGVISPTYSLLKKELLLFDRIAYIGLEFFIGILQGLNTANHNKFAYLIENLDYLKGEGLLFEPNFDTQIINASILTNEETETLRELHILSREKEETSILEGIIPFLGFLPTDIERKYNKSLSLENESVTLLDEIAFFINQKYNTLSNRRRREIDLKAVESIGKMLKVSLFETYYYKARIFALYLRHNKGLNAFPIFSNPKNFSSNPVLEKSDVLNLVLHYFPVPSDTVAYEQILDFKNDINSKRKLLALKNCISDFAKAKLDIHEIAEKLEYLIHEYEAHMRISKIKYEYTNLGIIITTFLEFIEDIVKIKWSNAFKKVLDVRNSKICMLQAELNAPGKEIAYIVNSKEMFSN